MKTLDDLFLATLKDIFYAERQILKALPKMARAAENEELRKALTTHRDETEQQVTRLQQVFEALGQRARGVTCEAINGIIEECRELLDEHRDPSPVRDAGLVASGQAVEHYEMARYGTLIAWATAAGKSEVASLLEANLDEEKAADNLLTKLASRINREAIAIEA